MGTERTHANPQFRGLVFKSDLHGRGNPRSERILIAATLYDPSGELAQGYWGSSILQLIHVLGEDNVFLSIYENDSGKASKLALQTLEQQVKCNRSIPNVAILAGTEHIKRIVYLAETWNGALQPLDTLDKPAAQFDKILFLNDVAFDPIDALQILFSTNLDPENNQKPQYRAACAFSDSGSAQSRKYVLAGEDAVPVRTRFRALQDVVLFWDASEYSLIHADTQAPRHAANEITATGIYMNPFVPLPWFNPRREELPGQSVKESVFASSGKEKAGSFQSVEWVAGHDGFCGRRGLQIIVPEGEVEDYTQAGMMYVN
ncbi:cryptococcal mannosyltransferase 1-domain-containing protein [Aspergillus spectabilis]